MDIIEDPAIRSKYQKYKLRVKIWEGDFMEKFGRKPHKNDIREAATAIKEAYKMYYKLKTQALDATLTDITFFDENSQTDATERSPGSACKRHKGDDGEPPNPENHKSELESKCNLENSPPSKESPDNDTTARDDDNVKDVWGSHLNKEKESEKPRKGLLIGRSSSFQLSKTKFTSTTFAKRNPRKSLSMTKVRSKTDLSSSTQTSSQESAKKDGFDLPETNPPFDEKLKIIQPEAKVTCRALNPIQGLMERKVNNIGRNINQGWLDRCSRENNLGEAMESLADPPVDPNRLSGVSDSGLESMESSILSPREIAKASVAVEAASDEEDFICNSDSEEEERKNKRIRNFRAKSHGEEFQVLKRQRTQPSIDTYNQKSSDTRNDLVSKVPAAEPVRVVPKVEEATLKPDDVEIKGEIKEIAIEKDTNVEIAEKEKAVVEEEKKSRRKPRKVVRKKNDSEDDSRSDGEGKKEKPTTSRQAKRTTTKKTKNAGAGKQPLRKTRATSKKLREPTSEVENDEEADGEVSIENKIPIYPIENLETTPRFSIPRDTRGNLIEDFRRAVSKESTIATSKKVPKKAVTAEEKFAEKVATGKANDNYVRLNMKQKKYSRGKKNFNFSRYKRTQWKNKKKELASGAGSLDLADLADKNGLKCFKCGESGHFSRQCTAAKEDRLVPLEEVDDSSEFPTLEEAEKMAQQNALLAHCSRIDRLPKAASFSSKKVDSSEEKDEERVEEEEEDFTDLEFEEWEEGVEDAPRQGHRIPEELRAKLCPEKTMIEVEPLYSPNPDGSIKETPEEVFEALRMFGHDNFRPGQEKAIMRILSGQSTLVTLSTGSGKSLCYQLPAYLYSKKFKCITLVISPLVSLMDDQVTGVPKFITAVALHTNQSPKTRDTVMEKIRNGQVDILLVSPEAVVAGEKSTGFGSLLRQLPTIAFACIDEAHCISQWSHNFRPSYLMVSRVLKEKLGVKTVLGLTATATEVTAASIAEHLSIQDGTAGVISDIPVPDNLMISVSKDDQRDQALIKLLRSPRFIDCDSIIVYCTRRENCTKVANTLRMALEDPKSREEKAKVSKIVEAYHAGLSASQRKTVQKSFMSGNTRIVVATVAFGMGINKADVRSVIHYNMPANFESYVQEIGRAGRDGLPAQCHLFLSPKEGADKVELKRHIYANAVDRHTIRRLLQKVFVPCSCVKNKTGERCPGHEVAFAVQETVHALDITEETISTLLCYLELHPKKFIKVLSSVYVTAKVSSYGGPKALKHAALSSPPLAMAIALDASKGISHENSSVVEFPVVDVASAIGWDSGVVKAHLKSLEWKTLEGTSKRSSISVRFDTLGFRVRSPGDLTESELEEALDSLAKLAQDQETSGLMQLDAIYTASRENSVDSVRECCEITNEMKVASDRLKETIRSYFKSSSSLRSSQPSPEVKLANEEQIASDIRSLVISYRDNNFTGRTVARIFHGISSPNYPAVTWFRCRFWRSHLESDFNAICKLATKEILTMR